MKNKNNFNPLVYFLCFIGLLYWVFIFICPWFRVLMTKTVQEYLNDVNYKQLETYKPSQFAIEFINFIKLVNGSQGKRIKHL